MSPSAHPALRVRVRCLCSADCTSLCKPRNRRDPSRRPCGHRGLGRRHAMGPGRAARVVRAEAKQQQEQTPEQKSVPVTRLCFCLGRARRALLLIFRGTHRLAAAVADQARRVGAGRADSAGYTDVPSAEPGRCRAPFGHDAQTALGAGACSFGYFSCTSKKSDSRGRRASESSCSKEKSKQRHWITHGSCRVPFGPFATRMFAPGILPCAVRLSPE